VQIPPGLCGTTAELQKDFELSGSQKGEARAAETWRTGIKPAREKQRDSSIQTVGEEGMVWRMTEKNPRCKWDLGFWFQL
jgi:hypothetical protein